MKRNLSRPVTQTACRVALIPAVLAASSALAQSSANLSNAAAAPANAAPGKAAPGKAAPSPVNTGMPPATVPPATGALPLPTESGPMTPIVSIDEAVRLALQRNPSLEQASSAVRRAQAAVSEARAFLLPRLDGDARFEVQGPIPSFQFPVPSTQPGQPAKLQTIQLGKTFTKQFGVTGTYDPDPFGRLHANVTAARGQVNVARGGYYLAQNELVYSVQNVYLSALRSQELINVAKEALADAQEQLRVAQAQYGAGTAPEFDVLRASVQVANNRQTLINAEANYRRLLATLEQVLSLDPQVRPQLIPVTLPPDSDTVAIATAQDVLDPAGPADERKIPPSLEQALSEAFTGRPEIYRSDWNRRVAEARVRYQRTGNLPSVGITAGYLLTPDAAGIGVEKHNWSLIANVAIPIWDAGLTRARVHEAKEDVNSAVADLQNQRDMVTEEVKRALLDLEEAAARRKAAAANTSQAREAVRIARVRYEAGVAATVEVTDAETALTQARTNEVNAAYDYLSAVASLNRALGRYAGDRLAAATGGPTRGLSPGATPPATRSDIGTAGTGTAGTNAGTTGNGSPRNGNSTAPGTGSPSPGSSGNGKAGGSGKSKR